MTDLADVLEHGYDLLEVTDVENWEDELDVGVVTCERKWRASRRQQGELDLTLPSRVSTGLRSTRELTDTIRHLLVTRLAVCALVRGSLREREGE